MAPRLVYLVTEDWYFMSHRLPMARAARAAGFDVHVVARVKNHGASIEAQGFHLHPINWRRGSLDPGHVVESTLEIRRLYRLLKPDIAHHVAIQASIAGSIAALGLPIVCVNSINGLGAAFTGRSVKLRLVRPAVKMALRALINRSGSSALVQTPDDQKALERLGMDPGRIVLIPGSGIDTEALTPLPEPTGPITSAFVGRLLEDKGVRTLVDAHDLLARRGRDFRLLIAGLPDPANPASIPSEEIEQWRRRPGIVPLGFVDDIATVWARAHIAVLPSRREGVPKSLLEAAACGRPIVAADVPGCRSVARQDVNALLVPADDASALADAIDRLAQAPQLRRRFAEAGRHLVEREFSSGRIGRDVVALYQRLLDDASNGTSSSRTGS